MAISGVTRQVLSIYEVEQMDYYKWSGKGKYHGCFRLGHLIGILVLYIKGKKEFWRV